MVPWHNNKMKLHLNNKMLLSQHLHSNWRRIKCFLILKLYQSNYVVEPEVLVEFDNTNNNVCYIFITVHLLSLTTISAVGHQVLDDIHQSLML